MSNLSRDLYNRHTHDDCMFHHNFVTRLEHLDAPNKIKLSYDQHMAHEIICSWMDRALQDEDFSGITDLSLRKEWVQSTLKEMDGMYAQTLGLCLCKRVQDFATLREEPLTEEAAVQAITAPDEVQATEEQQIQMRRLWKKNMTTEGERRRVPKNALQN